MEQLSVLCACKCAWAGFGEGGISSLQAGEQSTISILKGIGQPTERPALYNLTAHDDGGFPNTHMEHGTSTTHHDLRFGFANDPLLIEHLLCYHILW